MPGGDGSVTILEVGRTALGKSVAVAGEDVMIVGVIELAFVFEQPGQAVVGLGEPGWRSRSRDRRLKAVAGSSRLGLEGSRNSRSSNRLSRLLSQTP